MATFYLEVVSDLVSFFLGFLNNPFNKSFAFVFISVFTSVLVVSLLGFVAFEIIEFKAFVP